MNPCCVSTWHGVGSKYWQAFMDTSAKHGIEPQNADPEFWPGDSWATKEWFRKTRAQYNFVRDHQKEYSHFMFVDSHDILFAAGWDEILYKYALLNSPIVFGSEVYPWPRVDQKDLYPETMHRCRFLNAGFWMGDTESAMNLLHDMERVAAKRKQCDQGIAVDAFLSGKHPIKLDTACSLLFCCNLDSTSHLDLSKNRPMAIDTKETPSMFHGNGNSPLAAVLSCLTRWRPNAEEEARMFE